MNREQFFKELERLNELMNRYEFGTVEAWAYAQKINELMRRGIQK